MERWATFDCYGTLVDWNAGIAVVGDVLERTKRQPFAQYLERAVLAPIGMTRSSFEPTPAITKQLAKGFMWTIDGRVFDGQTDLVGAMREAKGYN